MLRKLKNLNQISEQLEAETPELEIGQIAVFQMLTGQRVQDVDTLQVKVHYPLAQIPMRSLIRDPHTKKNVWIGVPNEIENDEAKTYLFFVPGKEYGASDWGGKFELHGNRPEHQEIYSYLMLTDHNGKKPNRNTSVEALFEAIDFVAKAKSERKRTNALRDALNLIDSLSPEEAKDLNSIINNSNVTDPIVVMAELEDYAKDNPDSFNSFFTDPLRLLKTDIKKAQEAQIISFDPIGNKVLWVKGNVLIAALEKSTKDWLTLFAEWLQTSTNGSKTHDSIKKQLKQFAKAPAEA